MKQKIRYFLFGTLLVIPITPIMPALAITDGISTCSQLNELKQDIDSITYKCMNKSNSDTKLVWRIFTIDRAGECFKVGKKVVVNKSTYVCARDINDPGGLGWGLLNGVQEKSAKNSKAKPSKIINTIIINTISKPTPEFILNTNTPWPLPTGDLNKYKGVRQTQRANDQLGLSELHKSGITGSGYSIAFLDNWIDKSHPAFSESLITCVEAQDEELKAKVVTCPEMKDKYSHGQGVAGTIGGSFGASPGVNLISINGYVGGLNWVLENYKKFNIAAISVSIGAGGASREDIICGVDSRRGLKEVLDKLANEDIAVLFSTANTGSINWVREPNCLPGVISVASVRANQPNTIQSYSSISPDIDLLAPADFFSTGKNGTEEQFGGTSQATPFAAALFALGKQARPEANIAQIFYYIKLSAAPIDDVYVKQIPVIRPVEMVKALKEAKKLPPITLVKQIQNKSGG